MQRPRLTDEAEAAIASLLDALAETPSAPTTVRDRERARTVHIADSLSGLVVPDLAEAGQIADVGAGAGFPGLVLAAALPAARVDLIESVVKKCVFIEAAAARAGLVNTRCVPERAETWAASEGREVYDVVTARAVGRLSTLAELASPLLREGGVLIAWKGKRDPEEEAEAVRAAATLAMGEPETIEVGEIAGSRHRHIQVMRKLGPTPERLPRRPGMAKKRPPGAA